MAVVLAFCTSVKAAFMLQGARSFKTTHATNGTSFPGMSRQSQAPVYDSDISAALRPLFSHHLHKGEKKDQVCKGLCITVTQ